MKKAEKKQSFPVFTKKMKRTHTILMPNMLPTHFKLIRGVLGDCGYKTELLDTCGQRIVEQGLKFVHNDMCYPALLVIGQFISALQSGRYDLERTALLITQTGGGCRASNYIHMLRKALVHAGFGQIPVISLNLSGLEKNSSLKLSLPLLRKIVVGLAYGDMLMLLANQARPYEVEPGKTDALVDRWVKILASEFSRGDGVKLRDVRKNMYRLAVEFSKLELRRVPKVRVGVVGEIYIKYSKLGNNDLEGFLAQENCEVFVPGILNFLAFKVDNRREDVRLYGGKFLKSWLVSAILHYFAQLEKSIESAVSRNTDFFAPHSFSHIKESVRGVIGYGNKMGEGWLLTAEMLELAKNGFENIVCVQPFGCLPNHICGKGMFAKIKRAVPQANIVAVDYDPGASRVNQENRIKLMLAMAKPPRTAFASAKEECKATGDAAVKVPG